jgi:NAD(P)-dependent dehydrogenase (short-subunit alcohol dehydrogenase family)
MQFDQVALVVGGSRGIGAATAEALAANGIAVAVSARSAEACGPIVARIAAAGGMVEGYGCDAGRHEEVRALVDDVVARFGRLDIIVNNAGTMDPIGLVEDCDPQRWADAVTLNLAGAFNGAHAALPHLKAGGRGTIVNLSTGAAFHPLPGWSAYCASKAGLAMFTKTLAAELAGTGIRIYGFQPGMVNTEMTRAGLKVKVNRVSDLDPETFSTPDVPGRAIAWLCKERPEDLSGGEVDINAPEFRARAGLG